MEPDTRLPLELAEMNAELPRACSSLCLSTSSRRLPKVLEPDSGVKLSHGNHCCLPTGGRGERGGGVLEQLVEVPGG